MLNPALPARALLEALPDTVVVVFANLPDCPNDKSYQLWIIRGDQPKPQSAGVFDVEKGNATITIENLPVMTEIKGLAVTMDIWCLAQWPPRSESRMPISGSSLILTPTSSTIC